MAKHSYFSPFMLPATSSYLLAILGYFIEAKTNLISQWIAINVLFHSAKWCNMCRGNLCKRYMNKINAFFDAMIFNYIKAFGFEIMNF